MDYFARWLDLKFLSGDQVELFQAMISCISCENVHEFGQVLHSQFRVHHEEFVERQDYDVPVCDGMEFDQYATPASRYLIYHTDDGKALGTSRLTPTALSCTSSGHCNDH